MSAPLSQRSTFTSVAAEAMVAENVSASPAASGRTCRFRYLTGLSLPERARDQVRPLRAEKTTSASAGLCFCAEHGPHERPACSTRAGGRAVGSEPSRPAGYQLERTINKEHPQITDSS